MLDDLALIVNSYANVSLGWLPKDSKIAVIWRVNEMKNTNMEEIRHFIGNLDGHEWNVIDACIYKNTIWIIINTHISPWFQRRQRIKCSMEMKYEEIYFDIQIVGVRFLTAAFIDEFVEYFGS
jgi:hypothetical protein